jgi:hypothetical protein
MTGADAPVDLRDARRRRALRRMTADPVDLADKRFCANVRLLIRLGDRATYEVFREIGGRFQLMSEIERAVDRYVTQLDPEVLRALGVDR